MDNPEKLATRGTQDTGRKQNTKTKTKKTIKISTVDQCSDDTNSKNNRE
jgi:hypothetical protein